MDDSKVHWERIYKTKTPQEVSWTENEPNMSLELISKAKLSLDAQIIDVGGGDSQLVDRLIDLGYKNLTVLDISETAIIRAQERLGDRATQVKWVVSDVIDYNPKLSYDLCLRSAPDPGDRNPWIHSRTNPRIKQICL